MTINVSFIPNRGGVDELMAHTMLDAVHNRFVDGFHPVLAKMLAILLDTDEASAEILLSAPISPEQRLLLVRKLVEHIIPCEPVTPLVMACLDGLRLLDRWKQLELGGNLAEVSLGLYLCQVYRAIAIYKILGVICDEPAACRALTSPVSVRKVEEWTAVAFGSADPFGGTLLH